MDRIKVKYHNPICTIEKIRVGDWIDLKSAETIEIREGDSARISLGVSMELPKGYEAILAPRSSLFSNHGLLMVIYGKPSFTPPDTQKFMRESVLYSFVF